MSRRADLDRALALASADAAYGSLAVRVLDVRSALEGAFDGFFLAHECARAASRDARWGASRSSPRAPESSSSPAARTPSASAEGARARAGGAEASPRDSHSDGDVGRTRARVMWTAWDGVGSSRWVDALRAGREVGASDVAARRYYCSRSFVAKAAGAAGADTDDEEELAEADEDASLIYEFTDFAAEELEFMVKWNSVARRFRCAGEHETGALCEAFAETYARDLERSEFFDYFLRTMLGMVEFGVIDREGVVRALRTARRVTASAPAEDHFSESEEI